MITDRYGYVEYDTKQLKKKGWKTRNATYVIYVMIQVR